MKQALELNKSSQTTFSAQSSPSQFVPSYAPSTYSIVAQPPPVPALDWRDYFVCISSMSFSPGSLELRLWRLYLGALCMA